MNLLIILLSVMTWTVESKNAVTLAEGGTVPYDIAVSYTNTYNKGQVRAGDVATLTLGNLGGLTIERVSLAMRANTSKGAGAIELACNDAELARKTVTWQTVSEDVEVFRGQQQDVDKMAIRVTGTENSIYVDAFTIEYAPRAPMSVVLMRGDTPIDTLMEESGISGVILPWLQDEDHWRFRGWSNTEFWTVYEEPTYHHSNTRYFPENDTLWAVYQWEEANTNEMVYEESLSSGVYMYVNRSSQIALAGMPADGKMQRAEANIYDDNQHYMFAFVGADSVYITHVPTGTPIGYEGTQMAAKASPWKVYHEGDQTLFYATIQGKNYVLWLDNMNSTNTEQYAGLVQTDPGPSPMGLISTMMPTEVFAFTCHPEAKVGIDEVNDGMSASLNDGMIVQFGIYELHIKNGKKYIILKE